MISKRRNVMRYFFNFLRAFGFCTMLTGMSAMDSDIVAIPIAMMLAGLGVFFAGSHFKEQYT